MKTKEKSFSLFKNNKALKPITTRYKRLWFPKNIRRDLKVLLSLEESNYKRWFPKATTTDSKKNTIPNNIQTPEPIHELKSSHSKPFMRCSNWLVSPSYVLRSCDKNWPRTDHLRVIIYFVSSVARTLKKHIWASSMRTYFNSLARIVART